MGGCVGENTNTGESVYFDDFNIIHTRNNNTLQVVQTTDYYPFGLAMAAQSYQKQSTLDNDYLYNGKELQDEHNLGWMDYGARMYMSDIGRWGVVDPLASKYYRLTTYGYASNNPLVFIDPNGKELDYSQLTKGEKKEFRQMFRGLMQSGETGRAIVRFLKSERSGRIVLKTEESSVAGGTFTSNARITQGKVDEGGNFTGEKGDPARLHPEIAADFPDESEIGGVLNIDLKTLKSVDINPYHAFIEEAAHAAIFSTEANSNGSNLDVDLPRGNDEFAAKAIVGQIERESRTKIPDYNNDQSARRFGVQAFTNKSAAGFFPAAVQWRSEQTGLYGTSRIEDKVPTYFLQIIKN